MNSYRVALFSIMLLLTTPLWSAVAVGSPALPIESTKSYNTPNGGAMDVLKMRGRVVLVDFWATWCGPCVKGIPHMQELHDSYANRGLIVIGHTDGSSRDLESFIKKHNVTYPISVGKNIGDNYGVTGIPSVVLIDVQGAVAWQGHPARLDNKLIEKLLLAVELSDSTSFQNPVFSEKSQNETVRKIEEAITAGHIKKGWASLDRLVKVAKRKPVEAKAAEVSIQALIAWTNEQYALVKEKETKGDVYGAAEMAEEVAKAIGRREQGKQFSSIAKDLKKHNDYRSGKAFAKIAGVPAFKHKEPAFQKAVQRFLKKTPEGYYSEEAKKLIQ
jgi:thiol-disulfide isomerase/thioredoxin